METAWLLGDTPTRAVKAESIRTLSAATTTAERKGAFRHAEVPASVVAAGFTAVAAGLVVAAGFTAVVVAGIGNRSRYATGFKHFETERRHMRRRKLNIDRFHCANLLELAALVIILTCCFPNRSMAQQPGQKTFSSPQEASNALVTAMRNNDEKAMLDILGAGGKQIISSGDETEDAERRANFVQKYQEMSRLVKEPDGTTTLYIGAKNWPTPIPLVNKGDSWYFDTEAAKMEILFRRVGRNEISTIRVCQELVAAEKNYDSTQHEYARTIFSDEGQHNGLYWKAVNGEPQSPVGPLVASAVAEGYAKGQDGPPTPYRGYYFHLLMRQGGSAPGGEKSYIVGGKMTGGFAFVAYPAEYRSSGVMTFIVGDDGVVYQKDLGTKSDVIAKTMTEYNPDSSWRNANEHQEQTGGGQLLSQVGTITAVQTYQDSSSNPSATSYKVSLRVGNTVYTVVHTPRSGTDIGQYAVGRALVVLIGDGTITYNDILGNSNEVAILSRTTVPAQGN
jgi:Protein of unknown function (DUF2950)